MNRLTGALIACVLLISPTQVFAQAEQHQHAAPSTEAPAPWHFMQDGVVWLTYNNQGGPRGGEEFGSQNWWMGMLSRPAAGGTLQFNLMLSLDPLTMGKDGSTHGERPRSFHVYLRVRQPAPMGRMIDMIMTRIGH